MTKKALLGEFLRLIFTAVIAAAVVAMALHWLYGANFRWPLVYWLANAAAWGVWYFTITIHLSERYLLKEWLERRFGGEDRLERHLIFGSLSIGAMCSGIPAGISYLHHADRLAASGAVLLVAIFGVIVVVVAENIAIFCLSILELVWIGLSDSFAKIRRPVGATK